jgi:hypothetical protein
MNAPVFPKNLLLLLRGLSFLLFAGWAWQALRWGLPLRSFFWDQSLMEGPVALLFGMDWRSWAGSARVDGTIRGLEVALGMLFLLAAAVSLLARKKGWGLRLLQAGSLGLLLIFLLLWKERYFQIGQLLEHSIQFSLALFLAWVLSANPSPTQLIFPLKLVIALTFLGHGLYALGVHPVPGNFVQMTLNILPFNEAQAFLYLKVAGILDMVMILGLFWKGKEKWFLWYGILWGFLTAFARVASGFSMDFPLDSLGAWLHETLYRLGHGGIPLLLWLMLSEKKED